MDCRVWVAESSVSRTLSLCECREGFAEGNETPDGDGAVHVVLPDGAPVVYPQAARILCRIVVRLAKMERLAEDAGGTKEEAS
jgi:hypothetical protein